MDNNDFVQFDHAPAWLKTAPQPESVWDFFTEHTQNQSSQNQSWPTLEISDTSQHVFFEGNIMVTEDRRAAKLFFSTYTSWAPSFMYHLFFNTFMIVNYLKNNYFILFNSIPIFNRRARDEIHNLVDSTKFILWWNNCQHNILFFWTILSCSWYSQSGWFDKNQK